MRIKIFQSENPEKLADIFAEWVETTGDVEVVFADMQSVEKEVSISRNLSKTKETLSYSYLHILTIRYNLSSGNKNKKVLVKKSK